MQTVIVAFEGAANSAKIKEILESEGERWGQRPQRPARDEGKPRVANRRSVTTAAGSLPQAERGSER